MLKRYRVIAVSSKAPEPVVIAEAFTRAKALRIASQYPQQHRDGGIWAFRVVEIEAA